MKLDIAYETVSVVQEQYRIQAVKRYQELINSHEDDLQDIVKLASSICNVPVALITLINNDKQHFIAKVGLEMQEMPREIAFCNHTIQQDDVLIVPDMSQDDRFENNPLVTGDHHVRFYAGATLQSVDGQNIGSLCVIDDKPRQLTEHQEECLRILSKQAIQLLEFRLSLKTVGDQVAHIERSENKLRSFIDSSLNYHILVDSELKLVAFNTSAKDFIYDKFNLRIKVGRNILKCIPESEKQNFIHRFTEAYTGEIIRLKKEIAFPNKASIWWDITYSPARDRENNIIGVSFNAIDITEQKIQEQNIAMQNKHLCDIAQLQSHQIRGPVSAIIGLMNLIKEENKTCEYFQLMDAAVMQLNNQIEKIVRASNGAEIYIKAAS